MSACTYSGTCYFATGGGSVRTVPNVVVGAGQSLVAYAFYQPSSSATIASCFFNGTEAFQAVGTTRYAILKNPTVGTHDVVLTLTSDPAGALNVLVMVVNNLDQTTVFRTPASGTTVPISEVDDLVLGAMCATFGNTNTWTPHPNATSIYETTINTEEVGGPSVCNDLLAEYRAGLAGTTPMDFVHPVNDGNASSRREFVALIGAVAEGGPTQMAKDGGDNQTATVNTAPATALTVVVRDVANQPVEGVSVVFAVASGGGSLGGSGSVQTNQDGIATCPTWTLGNVAGVNTVTATHAGLAGSPLTFTATGTAGAATQMEEYAGNNQTAPMRTALPIPPAVKVMDQFYNPKPGETVSWEVLTGGGTVATATSQTNADGIASVEWVMGAGGSGSMSGAVSGLTGSPVLFNATATAAQLKAFQYRRRR